MEVAKIDIVKFINIYKAYPVLDVRSPGEFKQAHIPSAYSLPLFTDEERKIIGTAYKKESRAIAVKIGVKYFGLKMHNIIEDAEKIVEEYNEKHHVKSNSIIVHCWRGGMRSNAVAWLLSLYGLKVYVLVGGYKAFRNWALQQFNKNYNINILGGYTGSGKTIVLEELGKQGKSIVNLESLASHKGSAFGNIGMPPQPSQEMFENLLATALHEQSNSESYLHGGIWIEDESQRIGDVNIPATFWEQMRMSNIYFLDIPFEERLNFLLEDYSKASLEQLMNAVIRIKKRLGGLETKNTINYLLEGKLSDAFRVLLKYYDKWYYKGLHKRENIKGILHKISFTYAEPATIAYTIQEYISKKVIMND